MTLALITLLHVLVFVFWVGGDLGAYYASYAVADPRQPPAARKLAARIIADIDMAPRTCLVIALPTGLTLAQATGYVDLGAGWLALAWVISLVWLAVVWAVHVKNPTPGSTLIRADLALRIAAIVGIAGAGIGVVAGLIGLPMFLGVKLLLLAAAITCGLTIRRVLPPFGAAFARVLANPDDAEAQSIVAGLLAQVRIFVLGIWTFVTLAAFVGILRPF